MALSFPLGITRCVPQVNSILFPDNKYFKDQDCSVKMAEYCSRSFFACLWTSTPSRPVNRPKITWPIFSHLALTVGQCIQFETIFFHIKERINCLFGCS